jgi:hypothetical protein
MRPTPIAARLEEEKFFVIFFFPTTTAKSAGPDFTLNYTKNVSLSKPLYSGFYLDWR